MEYLWLGGSLRGQGIGRQLVLMSESEAKNRGCSRAWLRTFGFQARGFYEKLGYRVVGVLEEVEVGVEAPEDLFELPAAAKAGGGG